MIDLHNNNDNNNVTVYKGIPVLHLDHDDFIQKLLDQVFWIKTPKIWRVQLIQKLAFYQWKNQCVACIRFTGNGKSLPIYTSETFLCHVTLFIVRLLDIISNQASLLWYMANNNGNIFPEHINTIRERKDIISLHIPLLFDWRTIKENVHSYLLVSRNNIRQNLKFFWGTPTKKESVKFIVSDEAYYITHVRRNFCPIYCNNSKMIHCMFLSASIF